MPHVGRRNLTGWGCVDGARFVKNGVVKDVKKKYETSQPVLFTGYYWGDQINEGEVSATCRPSVRGEIKMHPNCRRKA
jgi:hypothetical protein